MKRVLLILLACSALIASVPDTAIAQRGRRSQQQAAQRGWRSNYQEALGTARRDDKPLMVVFRCVP